MNQEREYSIIKTGERNYRIMLGTGIVGILHWQKFPGHEDGYQFIPGTQRAPNRVLRPTLLEALRKTVRLPAAIAKKLAAAAAKDQESGQ